MEYLARRMGPLVLEQIFLHCGRLLQPYLAEKGPELSPALTPLVPALCKELFRLWSKSLDAAVSPTGMPTPRGTESPAGPLGGMTKSAAQVEERDLVIAATNILQKLLLRYPASWGEVVARMPSPEQLEACEYDQLMTDYGGSD